MKVQKKSFISREGSKGVNLLKSFISREGSKGVNLLNSFISREGSKGVNLLNSFISREGSKGVNLLKSFISREGSKGNRRFPLHKENVSNRDKHNHIRKKEQEPRNRLVSTLANQVENPCPE